MRRRQSGLALRAVIVTGALALAGASCHERGRPDPDIRMAVSHEREEIPAGGESTTPTVPDQLEVPPEVAQAFTGIKLLWKDSTTAKEGEIEVPLNGGAKIPDSDLEVRCDVFLPAFTMSARTITSSGIEQANPAARISVLEKGQEIFAGWIFTRFPDVHPFSHPRYSLRLAGGVARKGA